MICDAAWGTPLACAARSARTMPPPWAAQCHDPDHGERARHTERSSNTAIDRFELEQDRRQAFRKFPRNLTLFRICFAAASLPDCRFTVGRRTAQASVAPDTCVMHLSSRGPF